MGVRKKIVLKETGLIVAIGFLFLLGISSCDPGFVEEEEGSRTTTANELPAIRDYGDKGPFATRTISGTGPLGRYTMYLPRDLGKDGFVHPIATWGNGIFSIPSFYTGLLTTIASHGVVLIASNSSTVNTRLMTDGLDWLIKQNGPTGKYAGKLDTSRAFSIGYSLGGGAAVETGKHSAVIATISFHGLSGASDKLHGPLLLFTGTTDMIVSPALFVDATYRRSKVQTAYATLSGAGHLYVLGNAGKERAPTIAWIRLWAYGDEGAKKYFYGSSCELCKSPWRSFKRKNWPAD